jgi:hypothetical protein
LCPNANRFVFLTQGIDLGISEAFDADGLQKARRPSQHELGDASEINSSFHRPHRSSTWERWAVTTAVMEPSSVRFLSAG